MFSPRTRKRASIAGYRAAQLNRENPRLHMGYLTLTLKLLVGCLKSTYHEPDIAFDFVITYFGGFNPAQQTSQQPILLKSL